MSGALTGHLPSLGWVMATAIAAIILGTVGAMAIFDRQEL
jgi:hypothetical protein